LPPCWPLSLSRIPSSGDRWTLIGGTAVGTVLILLSLPGLCAAWFRIKPTADEIHEDSTEESELRTAIAAE
jgi:hypothetical protein